MEIGSGSGPELWNSIQCWLSRSGFLSGALAKALFWEGQRLHLQPNLRPIYQGSWWPAVALGNVELETLHNIWGFFCSDRSGIELWGAQQVGVTLRGENLDVHLDTARGDPESMQSLWEDQAEVMLAGAVLWKEAADFNREVLH